MNKQQWLKSELNYYRFDLLDTEDNIITIRQFGCTSEEISFNMNRLTFTADGGFYDLDLDIFKTIIELITQYMSMR